MSDVLDRGPVGPESVGPTNHGAAYRDYIEGMVLGEVDQLRWGANIIETTEYPLAQTIAYQVDLVEDAWLGDDSDNLATVLDFSFCDAVRSYVYSGLDIDPSTILTSSELLGQSPDLLRQVILSRTDFKTVLDLGNLTRKERRELRAIGRQAIYKLGLTEKPGWLTRLKPAV